MAAAPAVLAPWRISHTRCRICYAQTEGFAGLLNNQNIGATDNIPPLKITLKAGDFRAAVGRVLPAISKKSLSNSLFEHVLLEVEPNNDSEGHATVMATDGMLALKCPVQVEGVISGGMAAVPGKLLFDLLGQEGATTSLQISANKGGAGLTLKNGRSATIGLRGENAEDFPAMPKVKPAVKMVVQRGVLRDALLRTRIAAAREDESRQNLSSVVLGLSAGQAVLLATDGRLFARLTFAPKVDPNFVGTFILPLRAVDEICRAFGGVPKAASKRAQEAARQLDEQEVTVELQRERVAIHLLDGTTLGSQLLIGDYPDLSPLMNREPKVTLSLDRQELISHLRKVALFCGKSSDKSAKGVHMALRSSVLSLSVSSSHAGEYQAFMEVEYDGAPMDIGFNPLLLADILQHVDGDIVSLGLTRHGGSGTAIIRDDVATFILGGLVDPADP